MEKTLLIESLNATLVSIDNQMSVVMKQASYHGINPFELRNPDGSWPMIPLLAARATALAALASLRTT